jgi:hypothetical protein
MSITHTAVLEALSPDLTEKVSLQSVVRYGVDDMQ